MNAPRYTAHIGPHEGELTLIIRRAIPAGIDGPFSEPQVIGPDLGVAAAILRESGFELAGEWQGRLCYDGLRLEAELLPR